MKNSTANFTNSNKSTTILHIKKASGASDDSSGIVSFNNLISGKKNPANKDKMKKYHELLKKENSRQQNKFELNKKTTYDRDA